ncbi:MAG: CPBP family intramembrane glutamic endopeptidase [Bacteroidota bacterium]
MKHILQDLRDHIRQEAHWGYYLTVGLILGCVIWLNYFSIPYQSFEAWLILPAYGTHWATLRYVAMYGLPYLLAVMAYVYFHKEQQLLRSREFWIKAGFGILVLSFDAAFFYHRPIIRAIDDAAAQHVVNQFLLNLDSTLAMALPLFIFWIAYEKRKESFYGLTWKKFNPRPYLWLLLLMVPIVLGASMTEDFIEYYPTLKPERIAQWTAVPTWLTLAIFEFVYASDFLWTELIFRGFFVVGMIRVMGKGAILPCATLYAVRHFAKPVMETVGSIFGGYILGVIAFRSKSILGGFLVHVGIALLMDVFALFQRM